MLTMRLFKKMVHASIYSEISTISFVTIKVDLTCLFLCFSFFSLPDVLFHYFGTLTQVAIAIFRFLSFLVDHPPIGGSINFILLFCPIAHKVKYHQSLNMSIMSLS